jgi:hypothetical protein
MVQPPLTEAEIDALVVAQADDNSAWEEPIEAQIAALQDSAHACHAERSEASQRRRDSSLHSE